MHMFIPRWVAALIIYILVVMALLIAKPSLMFDEAGNPKPFGVGLKDGYSFLAPAIAFPVLAIVVYLSVVVMYLVFTRK